ncbi:MAG: basic amino acid/polyamine antiporter, family [Solirubrobacteraceae bacterium]|jgi:APA family basic amino acid/polyamine antiporter|nr:basic amino acid/polyamine antiporter, family [Solirubrobacteraceae bacterium]
MSTAHESSGTGHSGLASGAVTTGLGTGTAAGGAGDRVFLRKASGLIKTAGTTDIFIFNIGTISIGIGIGSIVLYGPSVYPGGNLALGAVLACLMMALIAGGMIAWTLTIPRSGGIYPFGSRALPPALAFTASFVECICWLFLLSVAAYWITTIGLAPTFTVLGTMTGHGWMTTLGQDLTHKGVTFAVSGVMLIIAAAILASGMRRFFASQKLVFGVAIIGSLVLIGALLFGSRAQFVANFNHDFHGTASYAGVIDAAHKGGWSDPGFSLKQTLLASNWFFLPLIGAAFSIAIGGEIKSATKAQPYGMLSAIVVSAVIWVITMGLANKVFGYEFLGSVGNNSLNGGMSTPTTPWITLLAGVLTGSPLVTIIISLSFIAWIWMWIPAMQAYVQRAMLAWSFDRVAPAALGRVSSRTHTPIAAIAVVLALSLLTLAAFVWISYFQTLIVFIEIALLAWGLVLGAGVVFPYRRPEMYEKSPIANKRLFGLPLMTVLCGAGCVGATFYFFVLFFDQFAAGHDPVRLAIMAGCFVAGLLVFAVTRYVRRGQGFDVDLAFKEIPIE